MGEVVCHQTLSAIGTDKSIACIMRAIINVWIVGMMNLMKETLLSEAHAA